MKNQELESYWDKALANNLKNGKTSIDVETGKGKGLYHQTVKAYANKNGYLSWSIGCGVWVIETNKNWLRVLKCNV
jgi:hypothetical protein